MSRTSTHSVDSSTDTCSAQYHEQETECLSVELMKGETKVVVGTTDGALHIFSKGHYDDCSDRFTAIKGSSVDSLVRLVSTAALIYIAHRASGMRMESVKQVLSVFVRVE